MRVGVVTEMRRQTWLRAIERVAGLTILIFLAAMVHRLFVSNINWDEFYYLSLVYLYMAGDLATQLQTIHVHVFGWLSSVSASEVQQIFAARVVVWVVGVATAWLIFQVARAFASHLGALVVVVLYLSFTYVMDHGGSFRADPFCALYFLLALHLLINKGERPYAPALAGAAMAMAMLVSIKSVFYLPAIGVVLAAPLWGGSPLAPVTRRIVVFSLWSAATFAVLFGLHWLSLAAPPLTDAGAFVASAGAKTLGPGGTFPAWPFVALALIDNALTWVLIAGGVGIAGWRLVGGGSRRDSLILLSLVTPLLSVLIYRNSFPYFFVFLMPAAVIPAAVAIDALAARERGATGIAALVAVLVVSLVGYSINYARKLPDQTVAQAETADLVHQLFPEPVPYIDRNSMIASYPKVGFFMSSWGLETYRQAGRSVMAGLIADRAPQFLIANSPALDLTDTGSSGPYELFDEDRAVLRDNFVPHWGVIYVAGKSFDLAAGAPARGFEMLIPGDYTVEATGPVLIDGAQLTPGDVVTLARGSHTIARVGDGGGQVTLRWGRNLPRPTTAPAAQPIYVGF